MEVGRKGTSDTTWHELRRTTYACISTRRLSCTGQSLPSVNIRMHADDDTPDIEKPVLHIQRPNGLEPGRLFDLDIIRNLCEQAPCHTTNLLLRPNGVSVNCERPLPRSRRARQPPPQGTPRVQKVRHPKGAVHLDPSCWRCGAR